MNSLIHHFQQTFTSEQLSTWINALNSGEYQQGLEQLYNSRTDTYCCMSVLGVCVLNQPEKSLHAEPFLDTLIFNSDLVDQLGQPVLGFPQFKELFSNLNDTLLWSFPRIAQFLQKLYHHEYTQQFKNLYHPTNITPPPPPLYKYFHQHFNIQLKQISDTTLTIEDQPSALIQELLIEFLTGERIKVT